MIIFRWCCLEIAKMCINDNIINEIEIKIEKTKEKFSQNTMNRVCCKTGFKQSENTSLFIKHDIVWIWIFGIKMKCWRQ